MRQVPDYLKQFVQRHLELGPDKRHELDLAFTKHLVLSDPRLRPKDVAELLLAVEATARLLGLRLPEEPGDRPLQWAEVNAGWTLDDLLQAVGKSSQPTTPTSSSSENPDLANQIPSSPTS
jgi:hypothetical protein